MVPLEVGREGREVEEDVARRADDGRRSGHLAARVDQLGGVEEAAFFIVVLSFQRGRGGGGGGEGGGMKGQMTETREEKKRKRRNTQKNFKKRKQKTLSPQPSHWSPRASLYPHFGHVPSTNRSARNVPAASE